MSRNSLLVRLGITAFIIFIALNQSNYNAIAAQSRTPYSICTSEIRVMPLGDSITAGKYSGTDTSDGADADDIGYRKDLWDLLAGYGYTVDFVGSQSNGTTYPFSDPQHEGHNGWTDAQVAEYIYNNSSEPDADWLSQNPPDMVLLHIGTNSLDPNPSDVQDILDEIDEFEIDTGRTVIVFVARIINQDPYSSQVTLFNDNVEAMVQGRPDYLQDIFLVDLEDGAGIIYLEEPQGDMFDQLHPFASGFTKMANTWMTAINDYCALQVKNIYLPIAIR